MIKFGMALMEMVEQLTKGYIKATGKQPGNLEKLKIQEEAIKRFKEMNKVVDMKGNPINPAEGILGGQQAQNFIRKSDPALYEDRGGNIIPTEFGMDFNSEIAKSIRMEAEAAKKLKKLNMSEAEINLRGDRPYDTDEQIKKRLMDQNKKSLDSMKKKLDEPEKKADGGRIGLRGGGMDMGNESNQTQSANMGGGTTGDFSNETQNTNHNNNNNNSTYDYTVEKQIAKQMAINTAKNVGGKKLASVLGLSQYSNPIGIAMALKGLYDKTQNPNLYEEEETSGIASAAFADGGRAGFTGGGMGRRGFLKLLGGVGAGIGALKSGILGFGGKKAGTQVAKEVAKEVATSGAPPPYFFKLVNKIKTLGDDVTQTRSLADRQKVTKYKDFELTEDVTTGQQTIQRMKMVDDVDAPSYYGNPLTEETYMSYKPGKGQADETMKGKNPPDEYEEGTAYLRTDREYAGEVVDEMSGISDDIFKEVGEEVPEAIRKTKADGGRIGYKIGSSKKGVQSLLDSIRNKFGKESITTADKIPLPNDTLKRNMFNAANKRFNKSTTPERETNIFGNKYLNDLDKKIIDSDAFGYSQKEWNNLSYSSKEKFRKQFDSNYEDAMENIQMAPIKTKSTTPESEKIVGDILEDTDINDLFDADGKLNKDAVLKAATSKDADKEILGQYSPENAVDDIFPSGDYKYDADIAAEAYVENNPQMFKNMLYEDLDDRTRSEVYSKVLAVINQRNAKMLQTKRNAKSIDISNDSVAEDFTNFIKKTDPEGFKELEQKLLLENAKKPKNRKLNASGGLAAMLGE